MPRRISIRGQGAALFFGDTTPLHQDVDQPHPRDGALPPPKQSSRTSEFSHVHIDQLNDRPNAHLSDRSHERPDDRSFERTKVRHSFDVFQDQLLSLNRLQMDLYRESGTKPTLGELVQRALDAFLCTIGRPIDRSLAQTGEGGVTDE